MFDWSRIEDVSEEIAGRIERYLPDVRRCLQQYETLATAEDEIARSVRALRGLDQERKWIEGVEVRTLSAFLPVNQPLYSLILSGVVPSLMVETVAVRPSTVTSHVVRNLWDTLGLDDVAEGLNLRDVSRAQFLGEEVSVSEAVVFTGTYATARLVMKKTARGALFVFNGRGVNPVVVMPDADVNAAVDGIVRATMYNSGQDCAAPDCVLVHRDVASDVIGELVARLRALTIGGTHDPQIDIGPVARRNSIEGFIKFASDVADCVVEGGVVDVPRRLISPTVIVSDVGPEFHLPELYAPVVNVGLFRWPQEVADLIGLDCHRPHAMYASVYGSMPGPLLNTTVLHGRTVLEHEDGNKPFGGLGCQASFVKRGGAKPVPGPVLISEALASFGVAGCRGRLQVTSRDRSEAT